MKITRLTGIKIGLGASVVAGVLTLSAPTIAQDQSRTPQDKFEYVNKTPLAQPSIKSKMIRWATRTFSDEVALPPAKGSATDSILAFAPDPWVTVQGQQKVLTFVVDVTNNILYHYDKEGNPIMGYRIASGKLNPNDQTDVGLRVVSHVETYPYKTAPTHTKRYNNPADYGPKCIILETLDPYTGKKGVTGEFIHGNRNASCIGQHASKGCMRMDNEVIKKLANLVKRDDLVMVIKRIR